MSDVIEGWKVGAKYKSESGEVFKIVKIYEDGDIITIDIDRSHHSFNEVGNTMCARGCKHGPLVSRIDQNDTTYKIGKGG